KLDSRPRIVRQQKIPVEIDVVAEARDLGGRRDAEARFAHAAEHYPQTERACGVRHTDRLTNAARLRELDVDAVRAVRARCDVDEAMTVLVDVDRDGRP